MLLALLLSARGRPLTTDTLIDGLWPDDPPPSARANVRQHIHGLRSRLGAEGRIRSQDGYVLVLEGDECDAVDLERLIQLGEQLLQHDSRAAARSFNEAIATWTPAAEAFQGLTGTLIEAERGRLARLRSRAVTGLCAAGHQNGDLVQHLDLIIEAAELDPLNEQLCGFLMRALAGAGRREKAVNVYQDLRHRLSADLGISPGSDVRAVYRELLGPRGPRAATPDRPAPCLLPPDLDGFVGRAILVDRITGLLASPSTAAPAVAIYGRGGVGKTALAVHVAHRLRDHYPDGQLFVSARAMEDDVLSAHQILDLFLRSLGFTERDIPQDAAARSAVFRSYLTDRRVLIVLDNVSNEVDIDALVPSTRTSAILLTSRAPLVPTFGTQPFRLDCPAPDEAIEMLGQYGGSALSADALAARSIVDACGSLPLAIRILGAQLALRPHLSVDVLRTRLEDEDQVLAELSLGSMDVSAAIDLSVRGLSRGGRELFCLAALLKSPWFSARMAAALLDATDTATGRLLDELTDAQLLDATSVTGHTRYQLHDLVKLRARQLAALDVEAAHRSAALSRVFGAALADLEAAQTALVGPEHLSVHGGALRWRPEPAGEAAPNPSQWAAAELAVVTALVEQAALLGMDEACWDLAVTMAPLLEVTRSFDEWIRTHDIALAATRAAGNASGEAAVLVELAEMHLERQEFDRARPLLHSADEAFERCGLRLGRALAWEKLGRLALIEQRLDEAEQHLHGACEVFRGEQTEGNLALALRCLGQVSLARSDHASADRFLREAATHAQGARAWRLGGQIRYWQGNAHLAQGRWDDARGDFQTVLKLFEERQDSLGRAFALFGLGRSHIAAGDRPTGGRFLRQALHLAQELDERKLVDQIRSVLLGCAARG